MLTWRPTEGNWTVVVMRVDGGAGISADMRAGATLPGLTALAATVLGSGIVLLLIGGLLTGLAVHRASQPPRTGYPVAGGPPAPRGPAASERLESTPRSSPQGTPQR